MLYETEMERRQLRKSTGEAFKPLSFFNEIQHEVFEKKDRSIDPALVRPRPQPGAIDRVPFMPMLKYKPAQTTINAQGKAVFTPPTQTFSFSEGGQQ